MAAEFASLGPFFHGGQLAPGIKVYHYYPGTSVLKNAWTDRAQTMTAAQPLVGDAHGVASAFFDGLYKLVITDANDTVLYQWDHWGTEQAVAGAPFTRYGATLAEAVAALGSTVQTLIIHTTADIPVSLTVPSNISLLVTDGAFDIGAGQTLTINGPFAAPLRRVFTGTGTVSFGNTPASPLYPQWWHANISTAITAILNSLPADGTTDPATPVHIHVPKGEYVLTSPVMIARNNLTLTCDGGTRFIIPDGQDGFVFGGESYTTHSYTICLPGVISGQAPSYNGRYGITLRNIAHSSLFANKIMWLSNSAGNGIRLEGSNFCNQISWNRIVGMAVGIEHTGGASIFNNINAFRGGEVSWCYVMGIRARRVLSNHFHCTIENMQGSAIGLLLDSARHNRVSVWFENDNTGHDLVLRATDFSCYGNSIDSPTYFAVWRSGSTYNIDVEASVSSGLFIGGRLSTSTANVLRIGSGNTNTIIMPGAVDASAVTNNAGTNTKRVTVENW